MMNSLLSIIGLLFAAVLVLYYYRSIVPSIKSNFKESALIAVSVIFLLVLFYLFFKSKGF